MRRIPSDGRAGLTTIELIVAGLVGMIVLLGIGAVYIGVENAFLVGSRKLAALQEATLLSGTIERLVRVGDTFQIYRLPDRATPADSGDGLAVIAQDGSLLGRLEWDSNLETIVNATGERMNAMKVVNVNFAIDPARPGVIVYRFSTDDERGNLVDFESAVTPRN